MGRWCRENRHLPVADQQRALNRKRFSVIAIEAGLGIEDVDARGAAVHEEENDPPRPRLEMGSPGRHGVLGGAPDDTIRQEIGQAEQTESVGGPAKESSSGQRNG